MSCCDKVEAYIDLTGSLHLTKEACETSNKKEIIKRDKQALHKAMREELSWYFDSEQSKLDPRHIRRTGRGTRERQTVEDFLDTLTYCGYDIIKVRDYG